MPRMAPPPVGSVTAGSGCGWISACAVAATGSAWKLLSSRVLRESLSIRPASGMSRPAAEGVLDHQHHLPTSPLVDSRPIPQRTAGVQNPTPHLISQDRAHQDLTGWLCAAPALSDGPVSAARTWWVFFDS